MLKSFGDFNSLHENVQWAKSYLTGKNIPLDDEAYQIIRNILEKNNGWVGVFVRFHYGEKIPVDTLAVLYDELLKMNQLLKQLPQPVDRYEKYEKLIDDLDRLRVQVRLKRVFQEMTAPQKVQFAALPKEEVGRYITIAETFSQLAAPLQRNWFKKITKYKTMQDLFTQMSEYVDSCHTGWNMGIVAHTVSQTDGAEIVYQNDETDILVVELHKYEASVALNGATQWCIRNDASMWSRYVNEMAMSRQYTIYNFNRSFTENDCMMGVTIQMEDTPTAIHYKNDQKVDQDDYTAYIKELGIEDALKKDFSNLDQLTAEMVEKILDPNTAAYNLGQFLGVYSEVENANSEAERTTAFKLRVMMALMKSDRVLREDEYTIASKIEDYFKDKSIHATDNLLPLFNQFFDLYATFIQPRIREHTIDLVKCLATVYFRVLSAHNPTQLDRIIQLGDTAPGGRAVSLKNLYAILTHKASGEREEDINYLVKKGVTDQRGDLVVYYMRHQNYDKAVTTFQAQPNKHSMWSNILDHVYHNSNFDAEAVKTLWVKMNAELQEFLDNTYSNNVIEIRKYDLDDPKQTNLLEFIKVIVQHGSFQQEQLSQIIHYLKEKDETEAIIRLVKQIDFTKNKYNNRSIVGGITNIIAHAYEANAEQLKQVITDWVSAHGAISPQVAYALYQTAGVDFVGSFLSKVVTSNHLATNELALNLVLDGWENIPQQILDRVTYYQLSDEKHRISLNTLQTIADRPLGEGEQNLFNRMSTDVLVELFGMSDNPDWQLFKRIKNAQDDPNYDLASKFLLRYFTKEHDAGKQEDMLRGFIDEVLDHEVSSAFVAHLTLQSISSKRVYRLLLGCKLFMVRNVTEKKPVDMREQIKRIAAGGDMLHFFQHVPNLKNIDTTPWLSSLTAAEHENALLYLFDQYAEQAHNQEGVRKFMANDVLAGGIPDLFQTLYKRYPFTHKFKGAFAAAATIGMDPEVGYEMEQEGAKIDSHFMSMVYEFEDEQQLADCFTQYPVQFDESFYELIATRYPRRMKIGNVVIAKLVEKCPEFDITTLFLEVVNRFSALRAPVQTLQPFVAKYRSHLDMERVNSTKKELGHILGYLFQESRLTESVSIITRFRDFQ